METPAMGGMPPPSTSATRLAAYWTADALAGDEAFDFSVLQELLRSALPKSLAGAPEATRERLALRGLQQVSSAITAGEGTPGALGVDGAHSCDHVLIRLITEVGSSGNWENDLLPPFSQDILETVSIKKHTLPETSFQLLKGLDPQITSMDPPSQLKQNGTEQCDNDQSMCSSHEHTNIEKPMFPTDNAGIQQENMENLVNESETGNLQKDPSAQTSVLHQPCTPDSRSYAPPQGDTVDAVGLQGTTMISHPPSSKAHLSALQNESGDKVNQNLEGVCASIRPMEKDRVQGDLALQAASVLLSLSCNGAIQGSKSGTSLQAGNATEETMVFEEQNSEKSHFEVGGANKANQTLHDDGSILENDMVHSSIQGSKSETNLQPGNGTEDTVGFEEQNADKSHLEVSGANKANQTLHDDGSILKNNMVHGGLTAQTAPVPQNYNVTLHGKTSEANCFSEQENEKRRTDVQKDNGHTSIPSSSHDGEGESPKKTSNEEEDAYPEIDINDTPEGLSLQDFCIKCGKDGQLLKCSNCSLVAHESCFGSSVTFEETDLFYCPVCLYNKATEAYKNAKKTYFKAWKNATAFLGTPPQVVKQHEEQLNDIQRGATKRDGHSTGCDVSKRKSINQHEAYNPAHRDEESHEQRKKQKTSARDNGKKQKTNARGNGYPKEALTEKVSFQNSDLASMNKHSVLQNNINTRVDSSEKEQQVGHKEACKGSGNDNLSHETRAASQRRCDPPANQDVEADQEDGLAAPYQSGSSDEKNDSGKRSLPPWRNMRHMSNSPRKKNYACQNKRYHNPVGPAGRRSKLCWKEEEEAFLREAMETFKPPPGETIPWVKILAYGEGVFERTRLPDDLRVKWRSMKKSAGK